MPLAQPHRISVALCTYNGEQFLEQQLNSIAQQTRLPDQLVVCDDRSGDRTLAMVRVFAATAAFPVLIIENVETLGSAKNFEQAMQHCDGDLIALSDQDDIWYPNRLQRSEQEFLNQPDAGLVFSDAVVIDEQDRVLPRTLWQRLRFAGKPKRDLLQGRFVVLAKHRFVTGATVMFRAHLRDRLLPIAPGWIHDEWIALITAAFAGLRPIDQPLIRYRIHPSQQVGFQNKLERRTKDHWSRLAESARELEQMCVLLAAMNVEPGNEVLLAYRRHLEFLSFRAGLPPRRSARLASVLRRASEYREHASGLSSIAKDLSLNNDAPI